MMFKTFKKYSFTFLFACVLSFPASAAQELDSVVAIVNDNVITQSQVNAMVFDMRRALQSMGGTVPSNQALKKEAIDQLISENLQLQIAARNNIVVSDADVDKTVANIATQNGISVDQLKQALAQEGISYSKFRTQIHDQIIVRELQRALFGGKIKVTDQEAKNYISTHPAPPNPNVRYHVDDLLVPVAESAPQAEIDVAKERAQELLKKSREGQTFSALATEDSGLEYNDLNWRTAAQLPPVFVKQIVTMNKDDVAGPIQAANGFHLLKLMDKQGEARQLTIEQAKNIVYQDKLEKRVKGWVEQIRQSAYVKIVN